MSGLISMKHRLIGAVPPWVGLIPLIYLSVGFAVWSGDMVVGSGLNLHVLPHPSLVPMKLCHHVSCYKAENNTAGWNQ